MNSVAGGHLLAQRQPDHPDRDIASNMIQPDFVVPDQWSAAFRRRQRSGETNLLAVVLICAWNDLVSPHRKVRLDARFFFELPDAGKPVSLRFLCEAFGLELSAVQQLAWYQVRRTSHKLWPQIAAKSADRLRAPLPGTTSWVLFSR
jgi:hypothetical protein